MEQLYLIDFLKFTQKLARSEVKALFYIRLAKKIPHTRFLVWHPAHRLKKGRFLLFSGLVQRLSVLSVVVNFFSVLLGSVECQIRLKYQFDF